MEIFTLNDQFQLHRGIENYQSFIWAERYEVAGDFELKAHNIGETLQLLPLGRAIGIRDSPVPMIVETHQIENPTRGAPSITVRGRSFETVLDRRAVVRDLVEGARVPVLVDALKEADAAYLAMRLVLGDFPQYRYGEQILDMIAPLASPLDAINEIKLILPDDYEEAPPAWTSSTTYSVGALATHEGMYWRSLVDGNLNQTPTPVSGSWVRSTVEIKPGNLYVTVMDLLKANHRGLKAVRPSTKHGQVGIEIYNGTDRREQVALDAAFDQFDDSTYLLSQAGSVNVAYAYEPGGIQTVLKTTAPEPTGLDRRVMTLDPEASTSGETEEIRTSRALVELYKYNATALFDGKVSEQVAEGYSRDYFLGDIIKLVGEYGLSRDVQVAEFIRTSDNNGESAYPTFADVD